MSQITDMAQYRAARQRPITDACRWLDAWEYIAAMHMRVYFAAWRSYLREVAR